MNTLTNFKDISQGGKGNVQKIIHNHASTCSLEKFVDFLIKTINQMEKHTRVHMREKKKLYYELRETKEELHRIQLENERKAQPGFMMLPVAVGGGEKKPD